MSSQTPPTEWEPDGRWNPWAALRRRPHLKLEMAPEAALLGGAMLIDLGSRRVVVLDPALDRRARRVALAHELIHDERGGGCDSLALPETLDTVVARDEAEVNREVARRLVPLTALQELLKQRTELHDPVELWEVADTFDVDLTTAQTAVSLLAA